VKAYLAISGAIFGLVAGLHAVHAIGDRHLLATDPVHFLAMAALGVLAAGLAIWAWRLLRLLPQG
jgi:hypothetical protein